MEFCDRKGGENVRTDFPPKRQTYAKCFSVVFASRTLNLFGNTAKVANPRETRVTVEEKGGGAEGKEGTNRDTCTVSESRR